MAEATTNTTTIIARADQHDIDLHKASDRVNFGSIREPIDVPYLLGVQTDQTFREFKSSLQNEKQP